MGKIANFLRDLVNPDLYEWCFKCKKLTRNGYRFVRWYGKIQKKPYCLQCGNWKIGRK